MKPTSLLATLFSALTFTTAFAGETQPTAPVTSEPSASPFVDPALLGFGAPGFSLAVTGSATMDYDESSRRSGSLDYLDARARFPVWAHEIGNGAFIGVSFNYSIASFDASNLLGIDKQTLHSADIQFSAARMPTTDSGWMGILLVNPGISSDLRSFNSDDFTFTSVAVLGYQYSPHLTLAVSGVYNHAIGEDTAIPGVGIIWKPTDTLTLQLLPPIFAVGWTPVHDWTFSLTAYPGGGAWNVSNQGRAQNVQAINLDLWRAGVGVEHRIGKNWRVTAVAGANLGGKIELRDNNQIVLADRDLKPSAFGLLGVAWDF